MIYAAILLQVFMLIKESHATTYMLLLFGSEVEVGDA